MDQNKKDELNKKWSAIVLKALSDDGLKKKLIEDPVGFMVENGLSIPEGCKVGEGTGNIAGLQLPANASDDLKEEVTWWRWRLEMTYDFGKDEKKRSSLTIGGAPDLDATPEL